MVYGGARQLGRFSCSANSAARTKRFCRFADPLKL
jgi:hypothetical protein